MAGKVIVITSGKGGVGKTTTTANIGTALAKAGNKVVLISASPDYLVPHLVSDMKFDAVFCSQMDKEKPYKYKFLCWNKNKVVALDKWAVEHKYIPNVIRSYSDSKYDMPIMEIAKEMVWIDPKTGLRK